MTESPDERVERLARAIYVRIKDRRDPEWSLLDPGYRDGLESIARAVIASDREAGMVTVPRELIGRVINVLPPASVILHSKLRDSLAAHEQDKP